MQYNEIYNICHPVMDWLKEQYPNNHKIVIDTTGAELIECGKLIALDKDLKSITAKNPYITKECEKQMQEILNIDTSEIKDDCHRFGIEMLQKLFNCEMDLCQYFGQKKSKDYAAFFSSSSSFCCGVK